MQECSSQKSTLSLCLSCFIFQYWKQNDQFGDGNSLGMRLLVAHHRCISHSAVCSQQLREKRPESRTSVNTGKHFTRPFVLGFLTTNYLDLLDIPTVLCSLQFSYFGITAHHMAYYHAKTGNDVILLPSYWSV